MSRGRRGTGGGPDGEHLLVHLDYRRPPSLGMCRTRNHGRGLHGLTLNRAEPAVSWVAPTAHGAWIQCPLARRARS
jgi:hypothetical protein